MKPEEFVNIAEKISKGIASDKEINLYLEWYGHFEPINEIWDEMETSSEEFKAELFSRIAMQAGISKATITGQSRMSLWPRILAAASVIIVLSFGGYFATRKPRSAEATKRVSSNIFPGSNKAVLTLSSGKQIFLSTAPTGTLAVQGNIAINKAADGKIIYTAGDIASVPVNEVAYNTITIPKGGQYQLTLPDGSQVFLNAGSSLRYPVIFGTKDRRVKLTGEAYFEVAKNPEKPFFVDVNGVQELKVLGTHFDIRAYADDPDIRTTLLEGSVQLSSNSQKIILRPGQMAVNDMRDPFITKAADIEEVMAWKNGLFVFNDERLDDVLKIACRWYDVEVAYRGNVARKKLWGTTSKYASITELLDNISKTSGIHYKIEGRRVVLMN